MKQIINGKLYNTDTAKEIGYYQYGDGGDFNYLYEALYKKRTGEFFLYGCGGANTCYGVECGNRCRSGGEEIIPYSEAGARKWAEKYLSADTYIETFGEVEE